MSSNRVSGVPAQLRALSRTIADVAPELERVATKLTSARLPEMPPGVAAVVAGTLSQVGESMRRAAVGVTREGLDVQRRSLWLEIAGAGGLLVTLHRPRPPGLWEPFPELGFGPFPRPPGFPDPEAGWNRFPGGFSPPPVEPEPFPRFPPGLGIPLPPLPGFTEPSEKPSSVTAGDGSEEEDEGEGIDPKEVPEHLPPSYDREGEPTRGEGGTRYPDTERRGEQVRVMPGNPNDPNPVKQGPYLRISRGGQVSEPIPLRGNPTLDVA